MVCLGWTTICPSAVMCSASAAEGLLGLLCFYSLNLSISFIYSCKRGTKSPGQTQKPRYSEEDATALVSLPFLLEKG